GVGLAAARGQDKLAVRRPVRLRVVGVDVRQAARLLLLVAGILGSGHHVHLREAVILVARAFAVGDARHRARVPALLLLVLAALLALLGLKLVGGRLFLFAAVFPGALFGVHSCEEGDLRAIWRPRRAARAVRHAGQR